MASTQICRKQLQLMKKVSLKSQDWAKVYFFIEPVESFLKPIDSQIEVKERFLKVKSMIAEYNEVGDKGKIDKASMLPTPISVKDIVLLPFTSSISERSRRTSVSEGSPMLRKVDQRKVNAYLSTPRFIKYLTDISELISSEQDKKAALTRELRKLNTHLPASVYIPFCQESIRNYAVLHVNPEEVHVFQTKTRCPYMITIEMYRPDEMSSLSAPPPKLERTRKKKDILSRTTQVNRRTRKESVDVSDYEEPLISEQSDDIFNTQRAKSNSVFMRTDDHKIDVYADKKVSNPLFISFVGNKRPVDDSAEVLRQTQMNQKQAERKVKQFMLVDGSDRKVSEKEEDKEVSSENDKSFEVNEQYDDHRDYANLSQQDLNSEDEMYHSDSHSGNSPSPLMKKKSLKSKTGDL
jgi:hypothetical protein